MSLSISVFLMACITISDFVEETSINVTYSILIFCPFRQILVKKYHAFPFSRLTWTRLRK